MYPIEFNDVWKKYSKGENFYSLRDALPNMMRSFFSLQKKNKDELGPNEFWVTKGVSFKVKQGEVLGIIGPNGAGKSTILKLLSKIMRPTKGEFKIRGRLSALIEVTAGFHPDFTGRENIYFNGAILGMTKKEIDSKFDEIVDFSGISEFIDTPVKRYSSGMSARLGFSIAAHVNPDVLLVDEVLAVGDMIFQTKCTQKMRELLKSGVTIIFISHNIPLVQSLCDRLILLDHGAVIKEGLPEEVVPCYENLVNRQREEELKKALKGSSGNEDLMGDMSVAINDVVLFNAQGEKTDQFDLGEDIKIVIHYEAGRRIDSPNFAIEIVRADNIVCCSADTKDVVQSIGFISGKGRLSVYLKDLNLLPGVYFLRLAVLDKDMVHTYVFVKKGIFKVNAEKKLYSDGVFLIKPKWEHQK